MSILDALRAGVKVIDKVTQPLQVTLQYERWLGDDGFGSPSYAAAVPISALEDWKRTQVRTQSGQLTVTRVVLTLVDVAEIVAATNGEGIDEHDKFTLADGSTGPILDLSGFVDAGTRQPVATEVMIG